MRHGNTSPERFPHLLGPAIDRIHDSQQWITTQTSVRLLWCPPPRGHTRDSLNHGTLRCERRNTDLSFRTVQGVGEPTLTPAGRPISFCIHPHELLDVIRLRGGLWPSTVLTMQSEGIIASVCAPPPLSLATFVGSLLLSPVFLPPASGVRTREIRILAPRPSRTMMPTRTKSVRGTMGIDGPGRRQDSCPVPERCEEAGSTSIPTKVCPPSGMH